MVIKKSTTDELKIEKLRLKARNYYHRNAEKCRERRKLYYWKNRKLEIDKNKKWCQENQDKRRLHRKKYYENNKEKCLAKNKEYSNLHPDVNKKAIKKYRNKNLEKCKKMIRDWIRNNRSKLTHYRNQRSLRKRTNGGKGISYEKWQEMIEGENKFCFYCGDYPEKLTMDHFIPLSKGGKHDISNIVPACMFCNTSKNNQMPLDFMKKNGYKF